MALTDTQVWNLTELSAGGRDARLMVEVQAYDSSTGEALWCDLNKVAQTAADDLFYNRLISPPQDLSQDCEVYSGRFSTRISTFDLDNYDAAFCKPLPWVVYDSSGNKCDLPTWYRARLRIRISFDDGTTRRYVTLGTFVIEQITPKASPRKVATVKLAGLEKILMDAKAKDFRQGDTWWTNIPADLAAKELVTRAMIDPQTGSSGATFETGSPAAASIDLPDGENECTALGNFPPTNYLTTSVIPRHSVNLTTGGSDYTIFAGYSIANNCPAVVRWNRTTGAWNSYNTSLPDGYEGVFAAAKSDGTIVYIFCVTNALDQTQPYPRMNHPLKIVPFTVATGAFGTVQDSVVYLMNFFPWRESYQGINGGSGNTQQYWGSTSTSTGRVGLPVYFQSRPEIPDYRTTDTAARATLWCKKYSDDVMAPRRKTGISELIIDGMDDANYFDPVGRTLEPGVHGATKIACVAYPGPNTYYPARTWLHTDHSQNFFFNSSRNRVYYIHYLHTSDYWRIECLNVETGARTTHKLPFGTLSWSTYSLAEDNPDYWSAYTPVSFCFSTAANLIVSTVTGPNSYDTAAAYRPPAFTRMFLFSVPTSGAATLSYTYDSSTSGILGAGSWAESRLYAPITIRHNATNDAVFGQVVNLWKPSGLTYGFYELTPIGVSDHTYTGATSSFPISAAPFTLSPNYSSDSLYAVDQASGCLWQLQSTSGGHVATLLTSYPVDGVSTWASCPPLIAGSTVYGVAAGATPADTRCGVKYDNQWAADNDLPQLGYYAPQGRITLWQYGNQLSNVVKVADFGEATVWDALEMLREISGDFVMGFNADGQFYFRSRATASYDYNLCRKGERWAPPGLSAIWLPADTLESKYDYAKLVNSVNVPVYEEELKPPSSDMILRPESNADAIGITVQQTNTRAQRVILRCISAGTIPASADTTNTGEPLLFSFQRAESDIQGSLSNYYHPTSTSITLRGTYAYNGVLTLGGVGIHSGDMLRVGDGDLVTITSAMTGGIIMLDSAIGGSDTHPVGTPVVITPGDKYRSSSSRQGVCVGTNDANNATVLLSSAVNGKIKIYLDSSARVKQGMVLIYPDKQLYLQVLAVHPDITVADSRGTIGAVTVKVAVLGSNAASYTGSLADIALMGALWVDKPGKAYAVSDYGVSITFHESSSSSPLNRSFAVGDVVRVTTFGLGVNEIENSMSRSINTASVLAHGIKEWRPPRVNRLIDSPRARWMLSILDHLTTVRWETEAAGCPCVIGLGSGDGVNVYDSYYWPDATTNLQTHTVTGYTLDLRRMTSRLSLMSTTAAPVGKQPVAETETGAVRGDVRGERTTRRRG